MMFQRTAKWTAIKPPQPVYGEQYPYKYRRSLKKLHAKMQRRVGNRMCRLEETRGN